MMQPSEPSLLDERLKRFLDERLKRFWRYWQSLRVGMALPERAAFNPVRLGADVAAMAVLEWQPPRLTARLVGSQLEDYPQGPRQGMDIFAAMDAPLREAARGWWGQVLAQPCGVRMVLVTRWLGAAASSHEIVFMPLAQNGVTADRLYVMTALLDTVPAVHETAPPIQAILRSDLFDLGFGMPRGVLPDMETPLESLARPSEKTLLDQLHRRETFAGVPGYPGHRPAERAPI
jgi:hypothetical protein